MPDKNDFGRRLKELRKKAGLTQEELAHLVGVHETTIRRWEASGNKGLGLSDIKNLCEVLHVSEADLLNGPGEDRWLLQVKISDNKEEFIDMAKNMPCIADLLATRNGAALHLAASYEVFNDDAKFKDLIKQLKKARGLVLTNGKALGWGE